MIKVVDILTTNRVEKERQQFKTIILGNPNYFGNMPGLNYEPVQIMSGNTRYEELMCIGLNPDANRLEAVVDIKQHYGYQSGACSGGSLEYIRFFVERADGWHDLGVVSFTSYDMTDTALPLSYSVAIDINEEREYCSTEKIIKVRGILSWNQEPPAGNPDWSPVWGNVLDVRVQIAPKFIPFIPLAELIADKQLAINSDALSNINLQQKLQLAQPKAISYEQLKNAYADKKVPGHRYGFTEAQKLAQAPLKSTLLTISSSSLMLGSELADILKYIDLTVGDTTYEELTCVGYNPHTRMLGGVISIKRNSGYSGNLCNPGSIEYVGFWVYYDGAWHSLGGAQVTVHDLEGVSEGKPVEYAVFRGVNLPEYLCGDITGLPLRAILSWQTPPTNPGFEPIWGNVVNTYIQPIIGDPGEPGVHHLRLMRIGRVTISGISDITGLANPTGIPGDCSGNDSPFGGAILIEGDFTNKLNVFDPNTGDVLPSANPLRYQVFVNKVGSGTTPTQLTNSFNIAVFPENAYLPVTKTQAIQNIAGVDYYTYLEGDNQAVNPRTLAVWQAGGLEEGLYHIEVKGFAWDGTSYVQVDTQGKNIYVYNGYPHAELLLGGGNQTFYRPELHLQIDPPVGGSTGDCIDVMVGQTITGTYSVTDHFFGNLSIGVVPITVNGVPQPINLVKLFDSGVLQPNPVSFEQTAQADTSGMSGTWTLSTIGMTPCGYTIVLSSWDRALVDYSCSGHYNQTAVGFCLRKVEG